MDSSNYEKKSVDSDINTFQNVTTAMEIYIITYIINKFSIAHNNVCLLFNTYEAIKL